VEIRGFGSKEIESWEMGFQWFFLSVGSPWLHWLLVAPGLYNAVLMTMILHRIWMLGLGDRGQEERPRVERVVRQGQPVERAERRVGMVETQGRPVDKAETLDLRLDKEELQALVRRAAKVEMGVLRGDRAETPEMPEMPEPQAAHVIPWSARQTRKNVMETCLRYARRMAAVGPRKRIVLVVAITGNA
jgi:hypothetical protein